MGWFSKPKGYRWSVYFVHNGNELVYVMSENSIMRMLGYIMGRYAHGGMTKSDWSIVLNYNYENRTILLSPHHFNEDGTNVTQALISDIEEIDTGWKVKGAEPVFHEASTKKRIPLSSGVIDLQKMIDDAKTGKQEITFSKVMDYVFQ